MKKDREAGLIDLIVMVGVMATLLLVLLPFGLTTARLISLKQTYAQSAYNLARNAVITGLLPPTSEIIAGYPAVITIEGSLLGCSTLTVSVQSTVTLSVLPISGAPTLTDPLHAAATVPTNAYLTPDSKGWDCDGA